MNNLHLVAVSLDVEKAYDMVWQHNIITTLKSIGFVGHILTFVSNFLKEGTMQVKIGNCVSSIMNISNGLPQGSIISVTLYLVSINSVLSVLKPPVQGLLFADDLTIFCTGKELKNTQKLLQSTLNDLSNWSGTSGFKFSHSKSEYIVFTK